MAFIGYSFWGVLEKPSSSKGVATTAFSAVGERHLLVDHFLSNGHNVACLQKRRETFPYPGVEYDDSGFPDIDILYLEWRWQQHDILSNERKSEPDWDRQVALLDEYTRRGTKIIAFDTDHKVTKEDELRWPNMIIAEPSLVPKKILSERIRLPWATDFCPYYETQEYSYNYIYLGNNYERDKQFEKYYSKPSEKLRKNGIQTVAYGNWIERSPAREDPTEIIRKYSGVAFGGRLSYSDGMKKMNESLCNTVLAKDSYYESGFVTSRVYEGILAGIPSLIPYEHKHILQMGIDEYVVENSKDVVKCVRNIFDMNKEDKEKIVQKQLGALKNIADFSVEFKANTILSFVK